MIKTYLYLPEELNIRALRLADAQNKSKASVLRVALEEGIYKLERKNTYYNNSAQSLIDLGEIGKKFSSKGPKDLSTNLDKYLWDE